PLSALLKSAGPLHRTRYNKTKTDQKKGRLGNISLLSSATDSCFTMRTLSASLYISLFALGWYACLALPVSATKVSRTLSQTESLSSAYWMKRGTGTWDSHFHDRHKEKALTNVQQKWVAKSNNFTSVSRSSEKPRPSDKIRGAIAINEHWMPERQPTQTFSGSADGVAEFMFKFRNYPSKGESRGRDWEKILVDEQTDEPPSKRAADEDPDKIIREANELINTVDAFKVAKAVRDKLGDVVLSNNLIRLISEAQQGMGALQILEEARTKAANDERSTRNFESIEGPTSSFVDEGDSSTPLLSTGNKDKKRKKKQQGGKGKGKKYGSHS
ncbi:hypothetical protein FA10DRAFT_296819, partial [Acaromyces ingoldii]